MASSALQPASQTNPLMVNLIPLGGAFFCCVMLLIFISGLDLQALYGPGGVKSIAALTEGNTQRDWFTWVIALFLPLTTGNIVFTARSVSVLGCALTVLCLTLLSKKLYNYQAAIIVALSASLYAPLCWLGILIGADAAAMGCGYLGLALAIYGINSRLLYWPLIGIGVGLAIFAVKIKIIALPILSLFAIVPFLSSESSRRIYTTAYIGLLSIIGYRLFLANQNAHISLSNDFQAMYIFRDIWHGLGKFKPLFQPGDVFPQLLLLAIIGIVASRKKRAIKLSILLLTIISLGYTANALGEKLRWRYLIPISLPVLMLAAGWLGERLQQRKHLWFFTGMTIILLMSLLLDTLAFFHQWSNLFSRKEHTKSFTLPAPPENYLQRYQHLSSLQHSDHSAIGIRDLFVLAQTAPAAGAATVPLRDAREFHLRAATGLQNKNYRILERKQCCRATESEEDCINKVITGMEHAGGRLILPLLGKDKHRIPKPQARWLKKLVHKAKQHHNWQQYGTWWGYFDGTGQLGTMPCQKRQRTPNQNSTY